MSHFDDETRIAPTGEGTWTAEISDEWSIGPNANGGYLLTPCCAQLVRSPANPIRSPSPRTSCVRGSATKPQRSPPM